MRKSLSANLTILIVISLLCTTCKKDDDNNDYNTRQPYAWAVGHQDSTGYGTILFSPDYGETWTRQGVGLAGLRGVDLINVLATGNSTVWAVGAEGSIFKTTDAGQNWARMAGPQVPEGTEFMSVSEAGSSTVWISGSNGFVISTSDGGSSWTVYDTTIFRSGMMQGICVVNEEIVYVVGGVSSQKGLRGLIGYTADGGQTWDTVQLPNNYNRHEWIGASSYGPENIVIYGMQGHYTYTSDGGASWTNDSTGIGGGNQGADINCLKMLSPQTWWASLDYDHIAITHDSGISWTEQGSAGPSNMFLVGLDHYNENYALVAGQSAGWPMKGKILRTSNGGAEWKLVYDSDTWIVKVSFVQAAD
ncbi:MAG: hypothetical protein RQ761_02515 [Bacteroidales bacterium]|nr:hypothetical protein [Bacteroidales bacterium]